MYYRIGKDGRKYWGKKGAGILFTDGKHILLLRRAGNSDHKNTWGLPGGKSKKGESAISTAKREAKEEIGPYFNGSNFGSVEDRDGRHLFTVFLFKIQRPFLVKLSKEHNKAEWVAIKDLNKYKLHPRFKENLDRYLKAISREFKHLEESFSNWLSVNESSISRFF